MSVSLLARNKSKPTKKGKKGLRNPAKPKSRNVSTRKGSMRSGINRKGVLDTVESVANMLPGAIRGVRSVLGNFREASQEAVFATPASFAVIQNNITSMSRESPVVHPTLGLSGVRIAFSQPLVTIAPTATAPGGFFRPGSGPATVGPDGFSILLSPENLGGPLAYKAATYQKYVFREMRVKVITYVSTTTAGTAALGIEEDPAAPISTNFQTLRMVTPSVTYPYRVPEVCLQWFYDGPELYFCSTATGSSSATIRQNYQALLKGYDAQNGELGVTGYAEIEGVIELYDAVPPTAVAAGNLREHLAVKTLLEAMRPKPVPFILAGNSEADRRWLEAIKSAVVDVPDDLLDPPLRKVEEKEVSAGVECAAAGGPPVATTSPSAVQSARDALTAYLRFTQAGPSALVG